MPKANNLRLLFLSFLVSFHHARPGIFPSPAPAPQLVSPSPTPSTEADGPTTVSDNPSQSPSPQADGPATVSDPPYSEADRPVTVDGPSPSPGVDGPTTVSNSPSPSPNTAGSATVSDGPSPSISPEVHGPTAVSDGPTLSPSPEADGPTTASKDFNFESSLGPAAADVKPKVKQMCDSTNHSELCRAILDGDTNVTAALETAIRTAAQLANIGLVLAKTTSSDLGVPPELASILMDCRDSYDYAVNNLESTLDAYPTRDAGAMKRTLSAAIKDVEDCEDGLSKYEKESPFASVVEKLVNMTNNCLAIVSLLN